MFLIYLKAFDSPRKGSSLSKSSKRKRDAFIIAQGLRWRDVPKQNNRYQEVFLLDKLPPAEVWATFKFLPGKISMQNIYRRFLSGS